MSVFTPEMIANCVSSCDERIASVQEKLNSWRIYGKVLSLVDLEMDTKYQEKIKNYENNIKLIRGASNSYYYTIFLKNSPQK